MNILVIGKYYTEGFALHIAETLAAMGHGVRRFEPGIRSNRIGGRLGHRLDQMRGVIHSATDSLPTIRARRIKALWHVAEQGPLDVVIVCHDFIWPAEVAELKRRTGAQVAMWFPDSIAGFGRSFFMNAPYDALFFKDPYIVHTLGDVLKSPIYYLPECFNPERHCLPEESIGHDAAYQCDITTAGNQHSWRVAFYKNLSDYDVKLWGNPVPLWMAAGPVAGMYQGRGVYNHDKVRAFRGAKIVVNNLLYGEIWGVNVRSFEAAGAGAFQMVDWRPGLGQLFEDGKELISFRSMADLKQKIDYWLPREAERCAIAGAGMRRAHAEHTYALRLGLLLDTLAGKRDGYPIPQIRYAR
ncbi:MAG: glycosyltransferase [Acidobacteriota bacterium]